MGETLLEVEGLKKVFRTHKNEFVAVNDVSFRLERGECLGIVGESGSGKSTLMNIIGVLDKPTSGEYTLDGVDIHKADDDELAGISAKLNRIQQKCSRCTGAFFVVYFCLNDKNGVVLPWGVSEKSKVQSVSAVTAGFCACKMRHLLFFQILCNFIPA